MMRHIALALAALLLAFSVPALEMKQGKQYLALDMPVANAPPVMEFFSFYCPHCYDFETTLQVPDAIKKSLPDNTKYVKYHVNYMGPLAVNLTHAWAVAITLGVEDKVIGPIFNGLQKTNTINTSDDIRKVFTDAAGITPEEYDSAWNSFVVKALVLKQEKTASDFKNRGVPVVYINGKYEVNLEGMDSTSVESFVKSYTDTVKFLLNKP